MVAFLQAIAVIAGLDDVAAVGDAVEGSSARVQLVTVRAEQLVDRATAIDGKLRDECARGAGGTAQR